MNTKVEEVVTEFMHVRPHNFSRVAVAAIARNKYGSTPDLYTIINGACAKLGIR